MTCVDDTSLRQDAAQWMERTRQMQAGSLAAGMLFRWYTSHLDMRNLWYEDMYPNTTNWKQPRTWTVHSPANLTNWSRVPDMHGKGHHGHVKDVWQATLLTDHQDGDGDGDEDGVSVLIKSCIPGAPFAIAPTPNASSRASRIAAALFEHGVAAKKQMALPEALKLTPSHECNLHEGMFLERLRGQPGIPELLGGWFDGSRFYYVTRRHGKQLCDWRSDVHRNVSYAQIFQRQPVDVTQAVLRCFQSFAELGDYYLMDFSCKHFTIEVEDARPVIYLVDAPLQRSGLGSASGIEAETPRPAQACAADAECHQRRSNWTTPEFNKTVDSIGRCQKDAASGRRVVHGGHCELDLSSYSSKTHVADVAQHQWLLPSLLEKVRGARAHAGLRQLIANMSLPPQQRPTFSCALESLTRLHVD